jgi:hypothetical protein
LGVIGRVRLDWNEMDLDLGLWNGYGHGHGHGFLSVGSLRIMTYEMDTVNEDRQAADRDTTEP